MSPDISHCFRAVVFFWTKPIPTKHADDVVPRGVPAVAAGKRWHTHFFFGVVGGKGYWTEKSDVVADLGGRDGWNCKASPIESVRNGGGEITKAARITCTHTPTGIAAEMVAACFVAESDRGHSHVNLTASPKVFGMGVTIECFTKME